MSPYSRRQILIGGAHASAALLGSGCYSVAMEKWPERVVSVIVPFPAGSATDVVARVVTQALGSILGRSFIVDNRPGGDSTIGTRAVARAKNDGYTLSLGTNSAYISAPVLHPAGYDPLVDFAPVAQVGQSPYVLAVAPDVKANTVPELIDLIRSKPPETFNYSSVGEGSLSHYKMALLAKKFGISLTHVPYKSTAQSIMDVANNIIQLQLASVPPTVSLYQSKAVKVLATLGPKRLDIMPDVPTLAEQGIADFEAIFWYGMFAPAGTPAEIVQKLNQALGTVMADKKIHQSLASQGVEPLFTSPAHLQKTVSEGISEFKEAAQMLGMLNVSGN